MGFDARRTALAILLQKGRLQHDHRFLKKLTAQDRRQAYDLMLGTRRRTYTWDAILRPFLKRGLKSIPAGAREALRMGIYELTTRGRTPPAIVVSETVAITPGRRALRGLVNAILRRVVGAIEHRGPDPQALTRDRRSVILARGEAVRLNYDWLPDYEQDPVRWATTQFSLTPWFVEQLKNQLPLEWEDVARQSLARLPITLRPRGTTTLAEVRESVIAESGRVLRELDPVLEVQLASAVGDAYVISDGLAAVQDRAAASAVPLLDIQPGHRVLDLCAAPGGKSLQILERLAGEGELTAAHMGGLRKSKLVSSTTGSGFTNVQLHDLGEDGTRLPEGPFDRILVDAPCSNSGVFAKRVDARYRCTEEDVETLAVLQGEILRRVRPLLKPGGKLLYSTCSILSQENQDVIKGLLATENGLALTREVLHYPHRTERDGGYGALLMG